MTDEERRAKGREYSARWRAKHPERAKEVARRHDKKRREAKRIADRARYWSNLERERKRVRDWQKANPEKHADAESRRRARQRAAPEVETIDRIGIYRRDSGRCHVCGKTVSVSKFELDHLTPLAKGGSHTRTNLRVAHRSCNARRNHGQIPAQLLLIG